MKPEGKYVARRSAYTVERAEHHEVVLLVRANHYSKSCSLTGLCWKISDTFGNIVGAAMFLPPLPPAAKYIENIAVQSGRVCVAARPQPAQACGRAGAASERGLSAGVRSPARPAQAEEV